MWPNFFWMGGMWIFPIIMFGTMFIVMPIILSSIFGKSDKLPCRRFQEGNSPLDILKVRYAKGEISREEFEQLKRELSD